jgi:hypothetical protein
MPRALYKPNEERVKSDRSVLVGIHPRERLRHVTFGEKQTQDRVHSVGLPNGMSTRFMERRERNSYVNPAGVVASFLWLLGDSTVRLCRDLELDYFPDLLPLVWIRCHFEVRVLR